MKLQIKVIPGSSRDCIAGWLGNILKIRVTAPAEKGKANNAVEKIITDALGISGKQVCIIKGKTSVRKIVEITGMDEVKIYEKIRVPD